MCRVGRTAIAHASKACSLWDSRFESWARRRKMKVKRLSESRFLVESDSKPGKFYEVDIEMPFCECEGFYYTKKPCKHIKLAREVAKKYKIQSKKS